MRHRLMCLIGIAMTTSVNSRSVAVIGGGFGGLACSNYIAPYAKSLILYDHNIIGKQQSASVASAGLMHPLTPRGKIIWKGLEGYIESLSLMKACQGIASRPIMNENVRITRPIFNQEELAMWSDSAARSTELLSIEYTKMEAEQSLSKSAIAVAVFKKCALVDSSAYLRSLWVRASQLCAETNWSQCVVDSAELARLKDQHDIVIIAAGPGIASLWSQRPSELPFKYVRGQNLVMKRRIDPEAMRNDNAETGSVDITNNNALLRGEYVIGNADRSTLLCGATHEYAHTLDELLEKHAKGPDIVTAQELLMDKLEYLLPEIKTDYESSHATAGIRVMSERSHWGKIPIIARHPEYPNVWMLGGFGARGLIHHAWSAKTLVEAALAGDEDMIPIEMRL